jgi:hypothetical protein
VYQLTCLVCSKKYTRQIGRSFGKTCKRNLLLFRKRNDNSEISHHLLQNGQSFGKLSDVMDILYFDSKLLHLDRFHVHKEIGMHNRLNDKHTTFTQ